MTDTVSRYLQIFVAVFRYWVSQRPPQCPLLHVCPNFNIATTTPKPSPSTVPCAKIAQRASPKPSEIKLRLPQNLSLYILSIHCHYFFLSGLCAFSSHLIIFAISAGSKTNRRNSRFYPGLWTVHIFPERLVFEILSAIGLYHHYTIQQWRRKMQLRWTGIY